MTVLDPVVNDLWHPISSLDDLKPGIALRTLLLDVPISYVLTDDGDLCVWRTQSDADSEVIPTSSELPVLDRHGYLWTSLGQPPDDLFELPEFSDPDRRNINAGAPVVAASAPWAVENFLDMGHFPFVHPGVLGAEPHTEVVDYDVEVTDDEVIATNCQFWVPIVAPNVEAAGPITYTYRVPHPFCAILYYENVLDPARQDVVALWGQAMTQERVRAHNYIGTIDDSSGDSEIKSYQIGIMCQDKPILENQYPLRLPLDSRSETPIPADKTSIAYRRWMTDRGIRYGVIRADESNS